MKIYIKYACGKEELRLEATTPDERETINEFAAYGATFTAIFPNDPAYRKPVIIIQKER